MYFIRRSVRKLRGKYSFFIIQSCDWNEKLKGWLLPFFFLLHSFLYACYTERREYLSKERFIYLLEAHFQHKKASYFDMYIWQAQMVERGMRKKGKNVKWCGEKKKIQRFFFFAVPPFLLAMRRVRTVEYLYII